MTWKELLVGMVVVIVIAAVGSYLMLYIDPQVGY